MDDQRKYYIDPEGANQRNPANQLQTNNLPKDDVENTNSTKKRRDLQLGNQPRIVLWGTERILQRIQRHRIVTLHRSAHPKREQDQTEYLAMAWIDYKKCIWYVPAKLPNKLPRNTQNIRWSHKLYWENHENLESGIDSRREKLRSSNGLKRYISRRCTITITIHNCDDTT